MIRSGRAFGWNVISIHGHDYDELVHTLNPRRRQWVNLRLLLLIRLKARVFPLRRIIQNGIMMYPNDAELQQAIEELTAALTNQVEGSEPTHANRS